LAARRFQAAEELRRRALADQAAARKVQDENNRRADNIRLLRDAEEGLQRGPVKDVAASAEDAVRRREFEEDLKAQTLAKKEQEARKAAADIEAENIRDKGRQNEQNATPRPNPINPLEIRVRTPEELAKAAADQQAALEAAARKQITDDLRVSASQLVAAGREQEAAAATLAANESKTYAQRFAQAADLALTAVVKPILLDLYNKLVPKRYSSAKDKSDALNGIDTLKTSVDSSLLKTNESAGEVMKAVVSQSASLSDLNGKLTQLNTDIATIRDNDAEQRLRIANAESDIGDITNVELPKLEKLVAELNGQLGPITDRIKLLELAKIAYRDSKPGDINSQIADLIAKQTSINERIQAINDQIYTLESQDLPALSADAQRQQGIRATNQTAKEAALLDAANAIRNNSATPNRSVLTRADADVDSLTSGLTSVSARRETEGARLSDLQKAVYNLKEPSPNPAAAAALADAALRRTTGFLRQNMYERLIEPNSTDADRLLEIQRQIDSLVPSDMGNRFDEALKRAKTSMDAAAATAAALKTPFDNATEDARLKAKEAAEALRDSENANRELATLRNTIDKNVLTANKLLIEAKFLQDKIRERNTAFNHSIGVYKAAFALNKKGEFAAALQNLKPPTPPTTSAWSLTSILSFKRAELATARTKTGPASALLELQSRPTNASVIADTQGGATAAVRAGEAVRLELAENANQLTQSQRELELLGIRPPIAERPVDPSGPTTQALTAQPTIRQRLAEWIGMFNLPGAKARSSEALSELGRQQNLKDLAINAAQGGVLQNTGSTEAFLGDIARIGNLVQNPIRSGEVRQQSIDAADSAANAGAKTLQMGHDAADALTNAQQIRGTLPVVHRPIDNVPSEVRPPSRKSVDEAAAILLKAATDYANIKEKRRIATTNYVNVISQLGRAYDTFTIAGTRNTATYDAYIKAAADMESAEAARRDAFDSLDSANLYLNAQQLAVVRQYAMKSGFIQYIVDLGRRYSIESTREAAFLRARRTYEKFTSLDIPSSSNAHDASVRAQADAAGARDKAMDAVQRIAQTSGALTSKSAELESVPSPPAIPVASSRPPIPDPRRVISETEEALATQRAQLTTLETPRPRPTDPGPIPANTRASVEAQLKDTITSRDATNEALRQQDAAGAAAATLRAEGLLKTAESERDALVAAGTGAIRIVTGDDPAGFVARAGADNADAVAALDTVRSEISRVRSHVISDAEGVVAAKIVLSSKQDDIPDVDLEPVRTLEDSLNDLSDEIRDLPLKIAEYDRILVRINPREGNAAFVRAQNTLARLKADLSRLLDPNGRLKNALRELDQKFNEFLWVQGIHDGNMKLNSTNLAKLEAAIKAQQDANNALVVAQSTESRAQNALTSQLSMRDMQNDMLASLRQMIIERRNIESLMKNAKSIRDSSSSSADSYRALKDAIKRRTLNPPPSRDTADAIATRLKGIAVALETTRNKLSTSKGTENIARSAITRLEALRSPAPDKPVRPEGIEESIRTEGTTLRDLQDAGARPRPPETPKPVDPKAPVESALAALRDSRDADSENLRKIDPDEAAAATEEATIALRDAQRDKPEGIDEALNDLSRIGDVFDSAGIPHRTIHEAFMHLSRIGDVFDAAGGTLRRAQDSLSDAETKAREAANVSREAGQKLQEMRGDADGARNAHEGVNAELKDILMPERIDNVPVEREPPATITRPTTSEIELFKLKSALNGLEITLKNANNRKNAIGLVKAFDKFTDSLKKFKESMPDDTLLKKAKQDVADALKKLQDADPRLVQQLHDLAVQRQDSLKNLDTVYRDHLKIIENRTRSFLAAYGKLTAQLVRGAQMKQNNANAATARRRANEGADGARKMALENGDKLKYLVNKLKAEKQALRDSLARRDTIESEIDALNKKKQMDAIEQLKRLKELGGDIFLRIGVAKKKVGDAEARRKALEDAINRKRKDLDAAIKKYGADSNEVRRLKDELDALKKKHDDAMKKLKDANDELKKLKDIADQLDRLRKEIEYTIRTLKDELGRRNKNPGIVRDLLGALAGLTGLQLALIAAATVGIGAVGFFGVLGPTSGVVQTTDSSNYGKGYLDGENAGRRDGSADGNAKGTQDYQSALAARNADASANARASGQEALSGAAEDVGSNTELVSAEPEAEAETAAAPETEAAETDVDTENQEVSPDDVVIQEGGQEQEKDEQPTEEEEQPTEEEEKTAEEQEQSTEEQEQPTEEQEQPTEEPEDEQANDEGNAAGSALGDSAAQSASQEPEAIEVPDPVPVPNPVIVRGMPVGKDVDYQQGYNDGYKSIYPDAFTTTYTSVFANPPEKGLGDIPTVPQIPQEDVSGCADLSGNPDLSGNTDLSGCADTNEETDVNGNPNATMVELQKGPAKEEEVEPTPEDEGAEPKSLSVSRVIADDDTVDPTVGGGDPVDKVEPTL